MKKRLRSGYTTGACAAAAAKAAAALLLHGSREPVSEILLADGNRVRFEIHSSYVDGENARVTIIKNAGDDPDVTNKAEIGATARIVSRENEKETEIARVQGGEGVGRVTKPGLSVEVGQAAINPVPMKMIKQAVSEVVGPADLDKAKLLEITIFVPKGKELAKKTLNKRLGIIGGLSILGTTGIVRPLSAEAWTATIQASMSVAVAAGVKEIIMSTGRTSERAANDFLKLPEEALVMMGDYLAFSLREAGNHPFQKIHIATMWAKLLKGAMEIPQTHVRHGALEIEKVLDFFRDENVPTSLIDKLRGANTAREILERLLGQGETRVINNVCMRAKDYYQRQCGKETIIHLVHGSGTLLLSL